MNVNTGGYGACTYMSEEGKHLRLATATVVFRHIHDRTQLTRTFLCLVGSFRLIPVKNYAFWRPRRSFRSQFHSVEGCFRVAIAMFVSLQNPASEA